MLVSELPENHGLNSATNPFVVLNGFSPTTLFSGTQTNESYSNVNDYIWENHSNLFSIIRRFNAIRRYEKKYKFSSKELLNKWIANEIPNRDQCINDWLTIYLQIKEYINE